MTASKAASAAKPHLHLASDYDGFAGLRSTLKKKAGVDVFPINALGRRLQKQPYKVSRQSFNEFSRFVTINTAPKVNPRPFIAIKAEIGVPI